MINIIKGLNFLTIIICIIFQIIFGMVWYMPFLFGKAYTKYTGIPSGKPPKPKNLLIGIICSIILVLTVAILLKSLQISTIVDAIIFGLIIGFGVIFTVNLPINRFNNYPLGLFFIDSGMPCVGIIINSIILTLIK